MWQPGEVVQRVGFFTEAVLRGLKERLHISVAVIHFPPESSSGLFELDERASPSAALHAFGGGGVGVHVHVLLCLFTG